MASAPDEPSSMSDECLSTALVPDDSIVISGMSALMPGCRGLDEFTEKLYNMENLVSDPEPRWKCNLAEAEVPFHGLIPDIEYFDAQFFMIHYRLANSTDTMSRKLLEQAYQAVIDAGVSPTELSGKRVGVFIATGITESCKLFLSTRPRGLGLVGGSRSMAANRISYWLNAKGPSYTLDASCCGSLVALEMAYTAIQHGHCDAAIVGGARLMLHPTYLIHYRRLVPLSPDSRTKCYDANADGQTMTEAVTTVFLQKYKDARRVYAEIYHIKSNFGYKVDDGSLGKFGHYRNPAMLSKFLRDFYDEAGVSPSSVEYVEGFGAAIPDIDKAELQSLEEVFCTDRQKPLLVGSVTSNIGFTGEASGLCGVVKLLLAYQRGELAANLHCDNPRLDVQALQDGRMRIVTKHEPFNRTFTALNTFSFTGLNVHLLLKGHYKPKGATHYHSKIPYLVTLSGRQESAVQKMMNSIRANELDPEEIALYHAIHKKGIQKHMARGYGIYETINQKTMTHFEKVEYFDDARRPLWFVYSGMGSQWAGMGTQLMRIPIFAAAIERCDKILKPKGLDIVDIITNPDVTVLENIMNCFIGIAAIQIGLTDVLRAVGLNPDHIIGHSVGELSCAYADGCCTAEELIQMSYSRGLISIEMTFIKGAMAAVGLGHKQLSKICPPEIDVACHNGPDSCTVSGPAKAVHKFMSQLTEQGIFAKEVKCSNIAYHSRYIAKAGPKLLEYTKQVIKEPKPRSKRWLSTSVERDRWHEAAAKYSSAEYHTNNLLRPVLFEETLRLVPSGAVLVEVAPHGLLQAILKRSLPHAYRHVPLTQRAHPDPACMLLDALGTLYTAGYDLDISDLYPRIEFPVSTETRQLSHLVEWVHTEKWSVSLYEVTDQKYTAVYRPKLTIHEEEYQFLEGSVIEGKRVFPVSGALVFVWDTLTMITKMPLRDTSIEFRNLIVHKQPLLNNTRMLRLVVMLQRGSGQFEVTHEGNLVVEGKIMAVKTKYKAPTIDIEDEMTLNSSDIYKLLFERGFEYRNEFRSIHSSNFPITRARLIWRNNWITFIDGALQLCTLRHNNIGTSQPRYIQRMRIDVNAHLFSLIHSGASINDTLVDAVFYKDQNMLSCSGLSIENIWFKDKPIHRQPIAMQTLKFVPFYQDTNVDVPTTVYVFLQIIAEYFGKNKVVVINMDNSDNKCVLDEVGSMINGTSIEQIDINVVREEDVRKTGIEDPDVIILNETFNANVLDILHQLYPDVFLVTAGDNIHSEYFSSLYVQVSVFGKGASSLALLRRKSKPLSTVAVTAARPEDLQCLVKARTNLQPHQKLVAFTSYPPPGDLKQLVKQWRNEQDRNQVFLAMVNDKDKVDLKHLPSFELPFNIFYENTWGGEYYLPLNRNSSSDGLATLRCSKPGDLGSLYWLRIPEVNLQPGEVKVQVHYAELNSYDAQRAVGRVSPNFSEDQGFGISFSGISDRGEHVMGIMPTSGGVSAHIRSPAQFLWPVPSHWSLEDAATVPLAYTIAFYCLGIKSQLVQGMSLLVNGGAGAVGQAAIAIALAAGCRVFTTVSDHNKKIFLTKLFPTLPADHIGNSRDDSFKDMVLHKTKGIGCNIVITFVKGVLKSASFASCGELGTIFDINEIHDEDNSEFGSHCLDFGRSYTNVDVFSIFNGPSIEEFKKIRMMISEGIRAGYVRPLSRLTYAPHEAARAFRLLATSQHRGRVLLRMHDQLPLAQSRLSFAMNSCHVILCDQDGFSFKLADRLVERGAKKLFLNVPNISSYLFLKKEIWEKLGTEVRISYKALDSTETVRNMFDEANAMGHIEGVHVVATDAALNVPTILYDVDIVSREVCKEIRFFTVISEEDTVGRNICSMRSQINLNSSFILLQLEKFADVGVKGDKKLSWRSAVDAVEAAMLSGDAVTVVKMLHQPPDFLQQVAQLPGVVVPSSLDDQTKLSQLGINENNAQELSTILENMFNVHYAKDLVPSLTVGQLKNLKIPVDGNNEVSDFSGYFSHIESDELLATSQFVYMSTLTHTPHNNMITDENGDDETILYIVPGIEDSHERFQEMCELLKLPAVVLHLGMDEYQETVQEIAQRLVEVLMKKLKIKNQFQLLGYEFGVPVVMEMATILESYGLTGTVYCLGGTAHDIQAGLEYKLRGMTEQTLQVTLLQHVHYILLGATSPELHNKLRDLPQFSDKVQHCVRELRGRVQHTSQYVDTLMRALYARLQLLRHCPTHFNALKAKVIILRAKLHKTTPVELLKLSQQDTIVHELDATLAQAPRDLRCSSIVNKYLSSDILYKFNKRNRCEMHAVNSDAV